MNFAGNDAETLLEARERTQPLPGDDGVPDATVQITRGITIAATPAEIWPWLLRMVKDELGAVPSPHGQTGNTMLACDAPDAIVLGALHDCRVKRFVPFASPRPPEFWHATWALVLEPIGPRETRLHVRSRVAATEAAIRWSAVWLHPFHDFMDHAELGRLKVLAEPAGREPRRGAHDGLFRRSVRAARGRARALLARVIPR